MSPEIQKQEDMGIDNDVDGLSDDSADDESTYEDASYLTLDSIPVEIKKKEIPYPLSGNYARGWSPQEAFREFAQNWRDAIIESNNLTPEEFRVYRKEKSARRTTEIVYKAFQTDANPNADPEQVEDCLGFIRYRGKGGAGDVEITNLNATLQPWHLDFGGTSKMGNEELAGAHGEGLKVAALVLLRKPQNHHLRCVSGGFKWNFNFTQQGRLVVRLQRMDMARENAQQQPEVGNTTPSVVADRDVQFIMGGKGTGRNENGVEVKRGPIQQTDFESWKKVALFLRQAGKGDTGIISTDHGDLLVAEDLRGSIYLKGLLLSEGRKSRSASVTGQPLWFGYNFAHGRTNRERQSMETADEESRIMCRILSSAMKKKPEMIGELVDIFNNTETSYADVACADLKLWGRHTGVLTRDYLLREEFANRWFYCSEHMNKNTGLRQCIESIGREPFEISKRCWAILGKYQLVRTAEAEALWRFEHAKVQEPPDTSFATSVDRLLRACIRACPQTTSIDVRYMQAGQLQLDVAISENKLLLFIHERWLDMQVAIDRLGLSGKVAEDGAVAFTVSKLFEEALNQLPREAFQQEDSPMPSKLHMIQEIYRAKNRVRNNQQMQVRVVDKSDDGRPGLGVEWPVDARPEEDNAAIEVQCHRASRCSYLWNDPLVLIASDVEGLQEDCLPQEVGSRPEIQPGEVHPPTCRVSQVPFQQGTHYEPGLEEGEAYFFVLLTPTDPNSFVRMSDKKCAVAPPSVPPNTSASVPAQPASHNGVSQPVVQDDDIDGESVIVVRHSESPEPADGILLSGRSLGAAQGSRAASGAPNRPMPKITLRHPDFSLGPPPDTLDLLALDTNRVYKAGNSKNLEAFIIFKKEQPSHPAEESRKRRRVD